MLFTLLIKVRVYPGSKKEEVARVGDDTLRVSVRERPENNAANARVKELLALYFAVPTGRVRLVNGARATHKIFEILVTN